MEFRSLLPGSAPAPSKLATALERLRDEPSRARRAELLAVLRDGPVLLGVRELPEGFEPAQGDEAQLRLVTAEVPGEGSMLCGFSSPDALGARAPAALPLAVEATTLAEWMLARDLPGLLLDPGGAATVLSRDEARGLLGLPPLTPRRSISLGDAPENAVRAALEDLLNREGASHVELREARTGKSLRFERAEDGLLRLVVPGASLSGDERARAEMLFDELAGAAGDLPEIEPEKPQEDDLAPDFQALFGGDLERPARAAVKVFTWVFGFPPGFAVEAETG